MIEIRMGQKAQILGEKKAADEMQKSMVGAGIEAGDDERDSLTDIFLCESEKVEE
jgi:hypothetical protein